MLRRPTEADRKFTRPFHAAPPAAPAPEPAPPPGCRPRWRAGVSGLDAPLALVAFRTTNAPHLVHLSCPSVLPVHEDLVRVQGAQGCGVDRCQRYFFLPECTPHGIGTAVQP